MKKCKTRRAAVPFGDQAAVFGTGTETVADERVFCGDYGLRIALVFGQTADEIENESSVSRSCFADHEHSEISSKKLTAKDAMGAKSRSSEKPELRKIGFSARDSSGRRF